MTINKYNKDERLIPISVIEEMYKEIGELPFIDIIDDYPEGFLVDVLDVHAIMRKCVQRYINKNKDEWVQKDGGRV